MFLLAIPTMLRLSLTTSTIDLENCEGIESIRANSSLSILSSVRVIGTTFTSGVRMSLPLITFSCVSRKYIISTRIGIGLIANYAMTVTIYRNVPSSIP